MACKSHTAHIALACESHIAHIAHIARSRGTVGVLRERRGSAGWRARLAVF